MDSSIVNDIEFAQHEYGKVKRKQSCPIYDPRPTHLRFTSNTEVDSLINNLIQHKENVAMLHVLSTNEEKSTSYPPPTSIRVKIMQQLYFLPHPLSLNDIHKAGNDFIEGIKMFKSSSRPY